jgi:hypothetical protein
MAIRHDLQLFQQTPCLVVGAITELCYKYQLHFCNILIAEKMVALCKKKIIKVTLSL